MSSKRWSIARHSTQSVTLFLLASPLAGLKFFSGNLAAAELFGLPLADPLAFLQALLGGHVFVASFLASSLTVTGFYFLLGGRSFCSWVCPVGLITELAEKLRARFVKNTLTISPDINLVILALVLVAVTITGVPLFEMFSPIGITGRAIVFGSLMPLLLLASILLIEFFIARRIWCRSICPLGGFYSLIAKASPLKVGFSAEKCTHCNDCLKACPVEEVLEPSLESGEPAVRSGHCTRCMACLEVCPVKALTVSIGYNLHPTNTKDPHKGGQ